MFGFFGAKTKSNKKKRKEDPYKNVDPKGQLRRELLNSEETGYTKKEMKAAENILTMNKTQPEYSKYGDAGEHMAVNRYDQSGRPPSPRIRQNRSRRNKTPTNRKYLDERPKDIDNRYDTKGKRRSLTQDMREVMEEDPYAFMGGKTRKRRRKRRRKTKRKGRRKTKKKRKMKKRKTRRKR